MNRLAALATTLILGLLAAGFSCGIYNSATGNTFVDRMNDAECRLRFRNAQSLRDSVAVLDAMKECRIVLFKNSEDPRP